MKYRINVGVTAEISHHEAYDEFNAMRAVMGVDGPGDGHGVDPKIVLKAMGTRMERLDEISSKLHSHANIAELLAELGSDVVYNE
tara:strand:+ start:1966 stop:2220 length:255 start_codon:yes stop_codon:yes gene_type:complete